MGSAVAALGRCVICGELVRGKPVRAPDSAVLFRSRNVPAGPMVQAHRSCHEIAEREALEAWVTGRAFECTIGEGPACSVCGAADGVRGQLLQSRCRKALREEAHVALLVSRGAFERSMTGATS